MELHEIGQNFATANVTVTTTTETVAVSSRPMVLPKRLSRAIVIAFGQLTTGAATTTVTKRIRRGTTITDTLVGEANAEEVKAAAGSTEQFFIIVGEDLTDLSDVEYSFTLQQAAATGNGTIVQAAIVVLILS